MRRQSDYKPPRTVSHWFIGRPLSTADAPHQTIGKAVGLAVFASDALSSTDGFTEKSGCSGTVTRDTLAPGDTRIVSSPTFDYDPAGNKVRATVTLCSNKGLNGTCVTDTITFKP